MDGSAILRAADPVGPDGITDGHVTLPELISFKIPRRLRVTQGNAGNHTALFRYRDQQDGVVTCTYRGGSSLAAPVTPAISPVASLRFVSCTNGAGQGRDPGQGIWPLLTDTGAPDRLHHFELHLDGCGGTLDPPGARMSAALAESFPGPQRAPDRARSPCRTTLYYALIYIENYEKTGRRSTMPTSTTTHPALHGGARPLLGKCGTVDTRKRREGL
jgi:hypothetical protein